MRQTGIWLDYNEAFIINLTGDEVSTEVINSEIDHGRIKGGSRSKTPWGPMEKTSESKFLERRKHQNKHYFEAICQAVRNSDVLFIMGPAEAKIGLQKHIQNDSAFQLNLLGVQTVDSMTDNQKIAKVKAFFA